MSYTRTCPFRGCGKSIHETLFCCAAHWAGMAKKDRDAIYACYRAYQRQEIGVEELRERQAAVLAEADPIQE